MGRSPSYKRISAMCAAAGALGTLLAAEAAWALPGQSVGRWRVPSTYAQVLGYGWGPGYHAPMVRYPLYRPAPIPRVVFDTAPWGAPFCGRPYLVPSGGYSVEQGSIANYRLDAAPHAPSAPVSPPMEGSTATPTPAGQSPNAAAGELVPPPPVPNSARQ